jgi:hypothetical protein
MSQIKLSLVSMEPITVAVAGTRVPLSATSLRVSYLLVQKHESNAGVVYFGDSTVSATKAIIIGSFAPSMAMAADDSEGDEDTAFFDLADMYVDAANSGDKVRIAYIALTSVTY